MRFIKAGAVDPGDSEHEEEKEPMAPEERVTEGLRRDMDEETPEPEYKGPQKIDFKDNEFPDSDHQFSADTPIGGRKEEVKSPAGSETRPEKMVISDAMIKHSEGGFSDDSMTVPARAAPKTAQPKPGARHNVPRPA